jgi:transposase-like protein
VRLAISDQHDGLKAAIARVLACPWQRCTVHFTRDMIMHCRRDQRGLVAAALREIFQADGYEQTKQRVTSVLERLEPAAAKVCRLLEQAEEDLLAFYQFPGEHWCKLRSTNPLERVNKEIGRRADVVGIFPKGVSEEPCRRGRKERAMPTRTHSRPDQGEDVVVSQERSDPGTGERREVFPGLPGAAESRESQTRCWTRCWGARGRRRRSLARAGCSAS